jgi:hypothetical protein
MLNYHGIVGVGFSKKMNNGVMRPEDAIGYPNARISFFNDRITPPAIRLPVRDRLGFPRVIKGRDNLLETQKAAVFDINRGLRVFGRIKQEGCQLPIFALNRLCLDEFTAS